MATDRLQVQHTLVSDWAVVVCFRNHISSCSAPLWTPAGLVFWVCMCVRARVPVLLYACVFLIEDPRKKSCSDDRLRNTPRCFPPPPGILTQPDATSSLFASSHFSWGLRFLSAAAIRCSKQMVKASVSSSQGRLFNLHLRCLAESLMQSDKSAGSCSVPFMLSITCADCLRITAA